jgi:hypothetical protein
VTLQPTDIYHTIASQSRLRALGPFSQHTSGSLAIEAFATQVFEINFSASSSSVEFQIVEPLEDWVESAYATMLASEPTLAKEWDTPEEDAAWADL